MGVKNVEDHVLKSWNFRSGELQVQVLCWQVDVALVVDAIQLMINSLISLMETNYEKFRRNFRRGMVYNSNDSRIMCSQGSKPWEHGPLLISEVKKVELRLRFDTKNNYSSEHTTSLC